MRVETEDAPRLPSGPLHDAAEMVPRTPVLMMFAYSSTARRTENSSALGFSVQGSAFILVQGSAFQLTFQELNAEPESRT